MISNLSTVYTQYEFMSNIINKDGFWHGHLDILQVIRLCMQGNSNMAYNTNLLYCIIKYQLVICSKTLLAAFNLNGRF